MKEFSKVSIPEPKVDDMQRPWLLLSLLEIPDIAEKLSRKDLDLDDRLKKVFVTSKDRTMAPDPEKINLNRPLPLDTKRQADYDYGHKEPENITPGRCTLKQAIQFISDHQTDAKLWPLPKIVDQYKLKDEEVFNVLHYFSAFKLHVPDPKKQKFIANADKSRTNRQSLLGGKQN